MSDTPETDAAADWYLAAAYSTDPEDKTVPLSVSRKLERERNEARGDLMNIHNTLSKNGEAIGNGDYSYSIIEMVENLLKSKDFFIRKSDSLQSERDEGREENGKLRDIAERAIEMKEQEVWGRSALSFSWKQLRAELDQIKEGAK
jgi:hypothetical protein